MKFSTKNTRGMVRRFGLNLMLSGSKSKLVFFGLEHRKVHLLAGSPIPTCPDHPRSVAKRHFLGTIVIIGRHYGTRLMAISRVQSSSVRSAQCNSVEPDCLFSLHLPAWVNIRLGVKTRYCCSSSLESGEYDRGMCLTTAIVG